MTGIVAIVVFVVGLVASIMVHEWGHFATARRFGMRADRFFLGFGPTLWSTRVGETEYGVKALPLGGFVRIAGMSPDDERLPGVPGALAVHVRAGDDPVESFETLLEERGTPSRLVTQLTRRYERTLAAGQRATAGAPLGVDLDGGELRQHPHATEVVTEVADRDDAGHDDHARATGAVTAVDPVLLAVELINSEVVPTGRVGDLHHRLTEGDRDRFFHDRPAWQRAIVLASGSLLHFAQAALLIFLGLLLVGPPVVAPVVAEFAEVQRDDGTVVPSAAEAAGLQVGDRVLAIDSVSSDDFEELRAIIQDNAGRPLDVLVERDDIEEPLSFTITPAAFESEDGTVIGLLGFVPSPENRPLGADEALFDTFVGPRSFPTMFVDTFGALGSVFGPEGIGSIVGQLTGEEDRDPQGGISIVGAASVAGQGAALFGPLVIFTLLASVNVFVGIFNALPLPPLDGGHIAVLAVEQTVNTRRRMRGERADYRVDPRTVASIALPVIVLVATVSLALVWLDVTDPLLLQ